MEFLETTLPGLLRVQPYHYNDERGSFVKPFNSDEFAQKGLNCKLQECFFSDSAKGVVRGMHMQLPPYDHEKLVFCTSGEVLDVVVDLRIDSPTYGKYETFNLSAANREALYLPKGVAHGFCSLSENATLFYLTTCVYNKIADTGIRYDSFGFEWPVKDPIVSERDKSFVPMAEFLSPWKYVKP